MISDNDLLFFSQNISFWNKLSQKEKDEVKSSAFSMTYKKGQKIYGSEKECLGLVLIEEGQIRVFIDSDDGKEISLYRLLEYDCCIFSASCMMKNITFDINIEAEKDTKVIVLPTAIFNKISEQNAEVKNFSFELVTARFSEVMWVFEQYVFGSAAKRLACFLKEHSILEESDTLNITHEFIANDLGTAREVITRLLKHFAQDGTVSLSRGSIKIEDRKKLEQYCS